MFYGLSIYLLKDFTYKICEFSNNSISFYYKYINSSFICQVTGDGEDKYLIATSEQPLCAYHLGDRIYPAELPIK
jgi:seryl-tRNA synthetase